MRPGTGKESLLRGGTQYQQAARRFRHRRGLWIPAVIAALLLSLFGLAACGSSGSPAAGATANSSGPGSAAAYLNCLDQHAGGGTRKACKSLRPPAGGLSAALHTFTSCLHSHGVALPVASPGAHGQRIVRSILSLRSGSPAQRSAFSSCKSQLAGG
jgi:hypothetical protein